MRICQNCESLGDYLQQSDIVVNKFKEKGYHDQSLVPIQKQVMEMDRKKLLEDKQKKKRQEPESTWPS